MKNNNKGKTKVPSWLRNNFKKYFSFKYYLKNMVSTQMYDVTSFNELRKDGMETERWNLLNSNKKKKSYVENV